MINHQTVEVSPDHKKKMEQQLTIAASVHQLTSIITYRKGVEEELQTNDIHRLTMNIVRSEKHMW